ncbi:MAG: response regulator transcription factor [Anaerolineaceae bacterium]|nr:response regulator transcription factor [Anaerolineaceae bacterium]
MSADTILVVDDEANIVELVRLYLEREGYQVKTAADGISAMQAVLTHRPALIVLDVMLPGMDGFEVCKKIRSEDNDVPIIMVTARDDDIDKILGLELGADDYLTKPFNPRELVARVKAILRRMGGKKADEGSEQIHLGDLIIDLSTREIKIGPSILPLRTQEFDLLVTLARQPGRVFSREQLLQLAWGFEYYGETRTVDVHIAHLRRKLAQSTVKLVTVSGVGYKLVA